MAADCRIEGLSDGTLVDELRALVGERNRIEAELLVRLAEVDRRRLYLDEAVDSMFRYCVERLGLSEAAAAKRIQVARLSRRFPVIISRLREGRVHLTALNLLAPQLTEENHEELLEAAAGKSKRDVERLLVARRRALRRLASIQTPGPRARAWIFCRVTSSCCQSRGRPMASLTMVVYP